MKFLNPYLINFLIIFFIILFSYLCTKKKLVKDIKIFLKKIKKQQYGHERYKNLSKDEKQNLVEYRKEYYRMRKNTMLQKLIT